MKKKLQLSQKVSNKVSIKNAIFFTAAGLGIFALLFVGAFFYFNIGNVEQAKAVSDPDYISYNNSRGLWKDASTWNRLHSWKTTTPTIGQYFTMNIYGIVTYESANTGDVFTLNNGGTLDLIDTLIIKGNASFGSDVNVLESGVLIILGNLNITSGNNHFKNSGRVVVSGNLTTTDNSKVQNTANPSNGFYVYGTSTNASNGSNIAPNVKNKTVLELNDPTLYKFVEAGGETLLPITLGEFTATVTPSASILVNWSTVSEKNNDFFTLERSTDGKNFEVITTMSGAGNSTKKLLYSFEDKNPVLGMNYYRLKQTDFNGDFEYFKIVGVHNSTSSENKVSSTNLQVGKVWPNPFKDRVNISFTTLNGGDVEVILQSAIGEIVFKTEFTCNRGDNTFTFENGDKLKSGIYYITLWQNGKKYGTKRIVKI